MKENNDQGQDTIREYGGYTGSSQYNNPPDPRQAPEHGPASYEQPNPQMHEHSSASYEQASQQQAYYPPSQGNGSMFYGQQSFAGMPPVSDGRLAAALCYSGFWLTGLLFLLFGGRNPFVRFHALQSLVFFGMINLIDFGLIGMIFRMRHFGFFAFIGLLIFLLVNLIAFVGWIVAMVQAGSGKNFRMPFVGGLVAKCINWGNTPRW